MNIWKNFESEDVAIFTKKINLKKKKKKIGILFFTRILAVLCLSKNLTKSHEKNQEIN